jgi:hypothetical protein
MGTLDRYYKTLELKPGASAKEIQQAYSDLAHVWNPDRFAGNERYQEKATAKFKEINEAYQMLRTQVPVEPKSTSRSGSTAGHKRQSSGAAPPPPPKSKPREAQTGQRTSGRRSSPPPPRNKPPGSEGVGSHPLRPFNCLLTLGPYLSHFR